MVAKKKKILILGLLAIVLIIAIGVGLYFYNNDDTDYVFEGTFVYAEDLEDYVGNKNSDVQFANCQYVSIQYIGEQNADNVNADNVKEESKDNISTQYDADDCFKRNESNCCFV